MSDDEIDEYNDDFYDKVFKAKADNPEMFVSNWEEDNEGICTWTEDEIKADPNKKLISEAEIGNLEVIKNLLETCVVNINAEDNDGYRALHRACYNGHRETANFLISSGADVNAETKLGWTALHSAVYWNQLDCVELLLSRGSNINKVTEGGQTALHLASSKCDINPEILTFLLSRSDINVKLRNSQGDSCEDLASRCTPYAHLFYPFRNCCTQLQE